MSKGLILLLQRNMMSTVQNAVDMNLRSCAILSDWPSKKGI